MSKAIIIGAIAVGACYALPRAASYLCTPPSNLTEGGMYQIRGRLSNAKEEVRSRVGEKAWYVCTNVIADNAWISALAISTLVNQREQPLDEDARLAMCSGFVVFSCTSWAVRFGLSKVCPAIEKYVGPRGLD